MTTCIMTIVDAFYKDYIPLFIMSAHKAWPDYLVKVFYRGVADDELLSYCKFNEITDGFYLEYPYNKATTSTMRFCIPDKWLPETDYFYITDIDMVFFADKEPLHEQHLKVMAKTGFDYENFAVPHNAYGFRMPGVHFCNREWWKKTVKKRAEIWEYLNISGSATHYDFDEYMLYKICEESGLEITRKGHENWRWHGLHLGKYMKRKGIRGRVGVITDTKEISYINRALEDKDFIGYMNSNSLFSPILEIFKSVSSRQ